MPVTINPVGGVLNVSVIDQNLENIQDLFKEGLVEADLSSRIDRFRIARYTHGRIVSVRDFENPYRNPDHGNSDQVLEVLDLTDRKTTANLQSTSTAAEYVNYMNDPRNYAMELLGKPGPSFWFNFQDDGIALSSLPAAWAPADWPFQKYPENLCFSRWLTVPGSSGRFYVDGPCLARITASASGSYSFTQQILRDVNRGGWDLSPPNHMEWPKHEFGQVEFALIVDTNPHLFADEFPNTNPHIKSPDGTTAPYKSWSIISRVTSQCAQRHNTQLWGSVALKGKRYYNFRLAFRPAGHLGWVSGGTGGTFYQNIWENQHNSGLANRPTYETNYVQTYTSPFTPNWVNLHESGYLSIDFHYGRSQAMSSDTDHSEHETFEV